MLLSLYLDPLATFPDDFPQAVSVVWVAVGVVGRGDGAVGAPDEAPAVRLNADPLQLETPQPTLAVGHQPKVHGVADRGRVGGHLASAQQVWSLTQFYCVGFSKSRIGVNKCIFYKRTIKVCVSCC